MPMLQLLLSRTYLGHACVFSGRFLARDQTCTPALTVLALGCCSVLPGFMSGGNGDSMDALASQAGAGSSVRAYLEARGITSVGTLAMVARDEDGYEEAIIRPLMAGFTTPAGRLELSAEEQPIARAVLLYMFNLAREARQAAAIATTPAAASP